MMRSASLPACLLGKNRNTVESLRELVAVPPRIEVLLRAFALVIFFLIK